MEVQTYNWEGQWIAHTNCKCLALNHTPWVFIGYKTKNSLVSCTLKFMHCFNSTLELLKMDRKYQISNNPWKWYKVHLMTQKSSTRGRDIPLILFSRSLCQLSNLDWWGGFHWSLNLNGLTSVHQDKLASNDSIDSFTRKKKVFILPVII